MKLRKTLAALVLTAVIPVAAACGTEAAATSAATTAADTSTTTDTGAVPGGGPGPGGPGGVDVEAVSTEAELVALVQEAHGDGALDLHRGHQPVQDVLDEVLAISHDELHVRMDAGQNLATPTFAGLDT